MAASASDEVVAKIEAALLGSKDIERVIRVETVVLDADELFVGAKVGLDAQRTMNEVSTILFLAEQRVSEAVPAVRSIFVEPDVWIDPEAGTPSTSTIVVLSSD